MGMFLGHYRCSLDEGNAILVPDHYAKVLAGGAFITQGFDRNIMVLTAEAFEELYKRILTMNIADPVARLLLRLFLGNASRLELDAPDRFRLPVNLAGFIQSNREVILVGQGEYFEVWALDHWSKQEADLQDVEENVQRFACLHLAAR